MCMKGKGDETLAGNLSRLHGDPCNTMSTQTCETGMCANIIFCAYGHVYVSKHVLCPTVIKDC